MGNYFSYQTSQQTITIKQKLIWKLTKMLTCGLDHKINQLILQNSPRYETLFRLLNLINQNLIIKFTEKIGESLSCHDNHLPFDYKKNFINWAVTFEAIYDEILYPDEVSSSTGNQIQVISNFVKKGVHNKKRIRGCGIRHSGGKIFADPQQLLVSFYPYKVAKGTSRVVQEYAIEMEKVQEMESYYNVEHLCLIRKVGQYEAIEQEKKITKHLIKLGAGVSNQQLRRWCIKNGYQYKSNVIMIQINVCGALGTCSHGAGINTQTLADYVYEIQFIDYNGNRQKLSKKQHPNLIKSAASAMGLLGLVIFVTLQMEELEIVRTLPRNTYKDYVIPWPKDYPQQKIQKRRQSKHHQAWEQIFSKDCKKRPNIFEDSQIDEEKAKEADWDQNFFKFKKAVKQSYCEWFYFPIEQVHVFENVWSVYGKKTPQNLARIQKQNSQGVFIENYPPPAIKLISQFSLFASSELINNQLTHSAINVFMRAPFTFLPHGNIYLNYLDGIHFQRGIQNFKVRNFQMEINIPSIDGQPDYDLIQKIWWAALEIVQEKKNIINVALQMRIFKGSEATLAPEVGYDYVCSIQILRNMTLDGAEDAAWKGVVLQVFNAWRKIKQRSGKRVTLRPHWGKQWQVFPQVKDHIFRDESFKIYLKKFLKDYRQIAKLKKFNADKNLSVFSNAIYRELLNSVIDKKQQKIQ